MGVEGGGGRGGGRGGGCRGVGWESRGGGAETQVITRLHMTTCGMVIG